MNAPPRMPTAGRRCAWVGSDELMRDYHDREWGVPHHDDRTLFELLILEGAQAGLSWITILRKRQHYREAFENFDAERIARYGARQVTRLLKDPGIVRNRLKVEATVRNARAMLMLREEYGTFDHYIWQFVGGRSLQNRWRSLSEIPAETPLSKAVSKDLLRRGFRFVGPTICYAFMQAAGLVNNHTTDCFRYRQLARP